EAVSNGRILNSPEQKQIPNATPVKQQAPNESESQVRWMRSASAASEMERECVSSVACILNGRMINHV
ncbi:hypothetical protein, partial [Parablautia sp. Marseille-Q6255]|uniref:hypothetical protein n=1 Tax=Parablautia sp. Marseille-Q6255 TaxID=3039593 RepID=UPI0024BC17D4